MRLRRGCVDLEFRLTCITASVADTSSAANGPIATQVAARLAAVRDNQVAASQRRPRRMSESAANVSAIAETGDETFVDHAADDAVDEAYESKRNRSTLSLVSMYSNETESSAGMHASHSSTPSATARLANPAPRQSLSAYGNTGPTALARSRKHRGRASPAPPQLHLDTVLASSLSNQLRSLPDHVVSAGPMMTGIDMFPTASSSVRSVVQPPPFSPIQEIQSFTSQKHSPSLNYDTSVPPTPRENSFTPVVNVTPRSALSASTTVKTLTDLI